MTEKDLDEIFIKYITTYAKIRLVGIYNYNLYSQFPLRIPEELKKRYTDGLKELMDNFDSNENKEVTLSQDIVDFIRASTILTKYDPENKGHDLDQILLRQDIISFFAYLEAFFQDVQRFIYLFDNTLLSSKDRTLTWHDIINTPNYNEIISLMIEKRLERSGYIKIYDLIKKWKVDPFKIIIRLKANHLDYLEKYTLIRNMIVHNNSKITDDLINKDSFYLNQRGNTYLFSFEEVFKLYDFINWLLFETFASIKQRFFNSDYSKLCQEYNYVENYSPVI